MTYRQTITKQSEILTFGKYHHKTIQHVLRTEPSYILWLDEHKIVKFPDEIIVLAHDKLDDLDVDYEPY